MEAASHLHTPRQSIVFILTLLLYFLFSFCYLWFRENMQTSLARSIIFTIQKNMQALSRALHMFMINDVYANVDKNLRLATYNNLGYYYNIGIAWHCKCIRIHYNSKESSCSALTNESGVRFIIVENSVLCFQTKSRRDHESPCYRFPRVTSC